MAVDLPPPIPPEQGTVQPGAASATVTFQDYTVHVLGTNVLGPASLTRAVSGADTLSNAVRAIASAYYAAGYPAARLSYALNGKDLYLLVALGGLSTVEGNERVGHYFNGLAGQTPLTDDALEPRRILASVHADRAGLALMSELTPGADGNSALTLKDGPDIVDPTTVRVEIGNPGSRFIGRYFIDFDVRTGTRWGDEFRAIARSGQHGISDDDEGDYFEQHLAWNRVTPWGIFGLGGRYVDYRFDNIDNATSTSINGGIAVGEAYWLYPLLADFNSRFTLQGKVDRTSKKGDLAITGQEIQRELYTSVEASATYQYGLEWMAFRWDLDAGLAVRKGLGDGESTRTPANQDYLLYRPALRIRNHLTERYTLALELSAQFSSDTVPEQQQWVLGGLGNISTALPGVAVGDQGYLARLVAEAGVYPLYGLELKPKVFIEHGAAEFDTSSAKPGLTDAGVELGVKLYDWLEGSVAYAELISDKDIAEDDLRADDANVFFRVTAKF